MRINRGSKVQVFVVALLVSATLVLGQSKRAEANPGSGEAGLVFLVLAAAVTYVTVMGVVCTPVAAIKFSDYPGGFSGAFGDCFSFDLKDQNEASAESISADAPVDEVKAVSEPKGNDA